MAYLPLDTLFESNRTANGWRDFRLTFWLAKDQVPYKANESRIPGIVGGTFQESAVTVASTPSMASNL